MRNKCENCGTITFFIVSRNLIVIEYVYGKADY